MALITGGPDNDILEGTEGDDTIQGLGGDDWLLGLGGNDLLDGGAGINFASYADAPSGVMVNLATGKASGGHGNDTLISIQAVIGSGFDDTLVGDGNVNTLMGYGGNDTISGGAGSDTLLGQDGNDVIDGGDGEDWIWGGDGNDVIDGGAGMDFGHYTGNRSSYTITQTATGYTVQDNSGNEGFDTLTNVEYLSFADQVVTLFFESSAGDDTFVGTGDSDTVSYADATTGITVDLSLETPQNTGHGTDTLIGIENLVGSNFNDKLTGNSSANVINGGGGADDMKGGRGGDTYYVDNPGDLVTETDNLPSGSSGFRLDLDLGSIIDTVVASISYSLGNYLENLTLAGSAGLAGSGNALDNILTGNAGNNSLDGGAGIDTAVFSGARANYTLAQTAGGYTVGDTTGADGTDTLASIERLQFADRKLALDLTPTGNAGQALEFIGMLAHPLVGDTAVRGLILSFFDAGMSMAALCQTAIDVGLVSQLAGSSGDLDLVRLVYRNVVGSPADDATASTLATTFLKGSGGLFSQADFLAAVAGLEINQTHINLVGLQATGIEYVSP